VALQSVRTAQTLWWKGGKVLVVKFKRRKNYRRHRGHRQTMTAVRITKIEV